MNVSEKITQIEDNNKKIEQRANSINLNEQLQAKKTLKESKDLITLNSKLIKEVEATMQNLDAFTKKEYNIRFKAVKDDFNIREKNVNRLEERINNNETMNKLKSGETTGVTKAQAYNAQRDAVLDLNLKGELHDELIGQIGKNLYEANDNLNVITQEVDKQGRQIDKISDDVHDTRKVLVRTDKRITSMNRRVWCHKFLLNLMIIFLIIAIGVVTIVKLTNK